MSFFIASNVWLSTTRSIGHLPGLLFIFLCFIAPSYLIAEGTKQLEPPGAPDSSFCRIGLMNDPDQFRIPFTAVGCAEEFRLNIYVKDFTKEKIYIGLGDFCDYANKYLVYNDVRFQLKDPSGNIVPGFSLRNMPSTVNQPGYLPARDKALAGPNINNTNPAGYTPLVISPTMNGNYLIEFDNPNMGSSSTRVLNYFDITVAMGTVPIIGRLWSKAWQLSSGSVSTIDYSSWARFYVYSDDSIVTRFDCNGLAGGIWTIYSNQWGCSTTGNWADRRRSVIGNTTVQPQYKIFLNDPDTAVFTSAKAGELVSFNMQTIDCDTAITFVADVNKNGNIEILIDVPPLNPTGVGPEDVQLVYNVTAGLNILTPPWDGKDALGNPLANGTLIQARIKFLNGLSNIPLFDVEDNPNGFKVNIQRPLPSSGTSKLRIFWDDSQLPPENNPTVNTADGCIYSGLQPVTGCHEWLTDNNLGNNNTVNSWWYFSTNNTLTLPVTLKLKPTTGNIHGPAAICSGQSVTYRTRKIPMAQTYHWKITGTAANIDVIKNAPDTTFNFLFSSQLVQGVYTLSVYGENAACGIGETTFFTTQLFDIFIPPVNGPHVVCSNNNIQYEVPSSFSSITWSAGFAEIIGSPDANPVNLRWNTGCRDTLKAMIQTDQCGIVTIIFPVLVNPSADADFNALQELTTCPGLALHFADQSALAAGSITSRLWNWGDGNSLAGNYSFTDHAYSSTGQFNVALMVTTNQGCISTITKPLNVIPFPMADFTYYRNCISDRVRFYDHSSGTNIEQWKWDFSTAATHVDLSRVQFPEASWSATEQFPVQLIVANSYGCADTIIKQVQIHPRPVAAFGHDPVCLNASVQFTDNSSPADTSLLLYSWKVSGGNYPEKTYEGNPGEIVFNDLNTYQVIHVVTDGYGCSDSISETVIVKSPPVGTFEVEELNKVGLVRFNNHITDAVSYNWDFGNGQTSGLSDPETRYTSEGKYTIALVSTSIDGCTDTARANYYYQPGVYIPTAFTPNNDGKNDFFLPVTLRESLSPYSMQIFDKWGGLIFESSAPSAGWDGTVNGRPCKTDVYIYIFKFNRLENGTEKPVVLKGMVSLVR